MLLQSVSIKPFQAARPHQRALVVRVNAAGGFGKSSKKKVDTTSGGSYITGRKTRSSNSPLLNNTEIPLANPVATQKSTLQGTQAAAPDTSKGAWNMIIDNIEEFFAKAGKDVKAVTLGAGRTLVVYRAAGRVFCSDVYSTAYKYPLVDAKITAEGINGAPSVEVPLDGTIYDLATGKVMKWCPTAEGNIVRGLLTRLKRNQVAVNLEVFPTHVTPDGKLWVNLQAST